MAKSSRLGAKGSFVIRERKVKSFDCVSSQALRLLCCFGGAISVELCSMVKCALWGLRGRTPYKVMQGSVCILAFFHVLRALATTEKIAASLLMTGDVRSRNATRSHSLATSFHSCVMSSSQLLVNPYSLPPRGLTSFVISKL